MKYEYCFDYDYPERTVNFRIGCKTLEGRNRIEAMRAEIAEAVGAETIFCNDLTGLLWMFDKKLPCGLWLENIHPSNDLRTCEALILI